MQATKNPYAIVKEAEGAWYLEVPGQPPQLLGTDREAAELVL